MKHAARAIVLLILAAASAAAQHVEVGGALAVASPRNAALGNAVRVVPVVRLAPKEGWGVAAGLNWFQAPLTAHAARDRIDVRPFMAGVGYTFVNGRAFSTVSVVAGPAWDRLEIDGASYDTASFAVRPAASISIPIARRVSATAFGGYLWNRATFSNAISPQAWSTNAPVFSVGAVVRVF
jgi:hypothetical protein